MQLFKSWLREFFCRKIPRAQICSYETSTLKFFKLIILRSEQHPWIFTFWWNLQVKDFKMCRKNPKLILIITSCISLIWWLTLSHFQLLPMQKKSRLQAHIESPLNQFFERRTSNERAIHISQNTQQVQKSLTRSLNGISSKLNSFVLERKVSGLRCK